jgi:hypothetical protein
MIPEPTGNKVEKFLHIALSEPLSRKGNIAFTRLYNSFSYQMVKATDVLLNCVLFHSWQI